ncbi:TonB-dependent receptor [Colwellia sp. RE-S-Sl-9]
MKRYPNSYRKKALSVAVATAIFNIGGIAPVLAEETNKAEDTEVIQIVGIRGSLINSSNIKREASGVVDAITAEDIGKFPDTNLAESLQRITGVSIDRANNEGNQVSVRGFGPTFNLVTLNNRQMPTSSTLLENGIDRSFNFREVAAESVSGVEVYKTGKANISSGGIGATINIQTAKPFDFDGFKAVGSAKGVIDTSVDKGDSITPELSGMISNTFMDGKLGVLVSLSHAERDSRKERVGAQGWVAGRGSNVDTSGIDRNLNPNGTHWAPLTIDVDTQDIERERQNGQFILQFAPNDAITASVDYVFSRFKEVNSTNRTSFWFDGDTGGSADANGTVTNPMRPDDELNFWAFHYLIETENDSLGLNLKWDVSESLNLSFDYHDSTSHSQPDGQNSETIINLKNPRVNDTNGDGTIDRGGVDVSYNTSPTGRPDVFFDAADLPGQDAFADQNVQFDLYQQRGLEIENNIKQFQFDGEWLNTNDGALAKVNFGLALTDYQIDTTRRRTVAFVPTDISSLDLNFASSEGFGSEIGGNKNLFPLLSNYSALEALELTKSQGLYGGEDEPTFNNISEETVSAYVSFDIENEFNDIPFQMNIGLRWESTDVEAVSLQRRIEYFNYVNTAGRFGEITEPDLFAVSEQSDYTRVLPNIDLSVDLSEDVIARFSYSTTLSRPDLSSMFPSVSYDARPNGPFNASVGNTDLVPLESKNIDLSLEWYYDEGSYASIGFFQKYVENFIGSSTREGTLPDINGQPLRDPSVIPQAGCPSEVIGGNPACFSSAEDPVINFIISTPSNLEDAEVNGWEINAQHLFGESGFGAIVNLTFVSGDVELDLYDIESTFALPGLSDSANLIGFYEKNGLQVRLAYNWRDDFLWAMHQPQNLIEPTFTEAYGQWDLNASYEINDNISVFVEGINITEETTRQHGRFADQLISLEQFGARYNVGITAKF